MTEITTAIVTLQQQLSHLMGGRTVDLRTPHELSRPSEMEAFRDAIG